MLLLRACSLAQVGRLCSARLLVPGYSVSGWWVQGTPQRPRQGLDPKLQGVVIEVTNEVLQVIFVAAPLTAGMRWYGERFWPQFFGALVISTFAQAVHYEQTSRNQMDLWLLAFFGCIAAFMALSVYQLDKRFKFTHWEKDPD